MCGGGEAAVHLTSTHLGINYSGDKVQFFHCHISTGAARPDMLSAFPTIRFLPDAHNTDVGKTKFVSQERRNEISAVTMQYKREQNI